MHATYAGIDIGIGIGVGISFRRRVLNSSMQYGSLEPETRGALAWSACFPSWVLWSRSASALRVNCCMLASAADSLSEMEEHPSSSPATQPSSPSRRSLRRSKLFWKHALRL